MLKVLTFCLATSLIFGQEKSKEIPTSSNPVVATVDVSTVYSNLNNALNAKGSFQSTYTSTVFNVALHTADFGSNFLTGTPITYYVGVKAAFENLPELTGTTQMPSSSSLTFDPAQIQNAKHIYATLTCGLQIQPRFSRALKSGGVFFDYKLFNYSKDSVSDLPNKTSWKVALLYFVPISESKKHILELEWSLGHDPIYLEPTRTIGRVRYDAFLGIDKTALFFDFSYNQSWTRSGVVELKYSAGIKLNLVDVVSALY